MGVTNCQWRSGIACAMLLLAVGACDGGEESVATTAVITAAPTSTVATTSTTTVATTTPATTEVSTKVAPTTVPAHTTSPTTAAGDEEAAKAAVIAALVEANDAWWKARQDPTNREAMDRALAAFDGDAEKFVVERIAEMVAGAERTVPSTEFQASFLVFPESVAVDLMAGTATARACEQNPWVLVSENGSNDQTILDDSVWTFVVQDELTMVNGSWQLSRSTVELQTEGIQACDDL